MSIGFFKIFKIFFQEKIEKITHLCYYQDTIINKKDVTIMTMGTYIKQLREEMGISQEELGRSLNPPVNRAAVNKWETGQVENIKGHTFSSLQRSLVFPLVN